MVPTVIHKDVMWHYEINKAAKDYFAAVEAANARYSENRDFIQGVYDHAASVAQAKERYHTEVHAAQNRRTFGP